MSKPNRRDRRTRVAAAVLATAVALSVPAAAQAHKKLYPTSIAVTAMKGVNTEGKVTSSPRCIAGRSVSVYTANGVLIDSTLTDASGAFKAKTKVDAGSYYATVKRQVIRRDRKHKHICRAAETTFQVS